MNWLTVAVDFLRLPLRHLARSSVRPRRRAPHRRPLLRYHRDRDLRLSAATAWHRQKCGLALVLHACLARPGEGKADRRGALRVHPRERLGPRYCLQSAARRRTRLLRQMEREQIIQCRRGGAGVPRPSHAEQRSRGATDRHPRDLPSIVTRPHSRPRHREFGHDGPRRTRARRVPAVGSRRPRRLRSHGTVTRQHYGGVRLAARWIPECPALYGMNSSRKSSECPLKIAG